MFSGRQDPQRHNVSDLVEYLLLFAWLGVF